MRPISIGIRDAKLNLSKLLKEVQKGAEIIITDRSKPVGKIIPYTGEENLTLNERLTSLDREGIIQPLKNRKRGHLPPPLPLPQELGQKMLQEDRG